LKRSTKFINLSPNSVEKSVGRTQINKIRNEGGKITSTTEIQRNIREHYAKLYANKFDNLGKNG